MPVPLVFFFDRSRNVSVVEGHLQKKVCGVSGMRPKGHRGDMHLVVLGRGRLLWSIVLCISGFVRVRTLPDVLHIHI